MQEGSSRNNLAVDLLLLSSGIAVVVLLVYLTQASLGVLGFAGLSLLIQIGLLLLAARLLRRQQTAEAEKREQVSKRVEQLQREYEAALLLLVQTKEDDRRISAARQAAEIMGAGLRTSVGVATDEDPPFGPYAAPITT